MTNFSYPEFKILLKEAKFDDALKYVDNHLGRVGDDARLLAVKARLIQLSEDRGNKYSLKEAESCYLRAHELAPKDLSIIEDLAHFYDAVMADSEKAVHFAKLWTDESGEVLSSMKSIIKD